MSILAASSLSIACRAIADYVADSLKVAGAETQVVVGAPWMVSALGDSERRLGLFFYRVEPSGFDADTTTQQTWWLRLHCVVTAHAITESSISAGENDLRLLGHVLRLFHEAPVFGPVDLDGEQMVAQVIFEPLSLDDINRLWSSQKDTAFRPSLGYEFALVPVIPSKKAAEPKLAGAVGVSARGALDPRAPFTGDVKKRPFALAAVDVQVRGWAPQIALYIDGEDVEFMSFTIAGRPSSVEVSVAGAAGQTITFAWDVWDAKGWTTSPTTTSFTLSPGKRAKVDLPFTGTLTGATQAVLYATRSYPDPWNDKLSVTVRSNPLLLSLYQWMP